MILPVLSSAQMRRTCAQEKLLVSRAVHESLRNPYAGFFDFGVRQSEVLPESQARPDLRLHLIRNIIGSLLEASYFLPLRIPEFFCFFFDVCGVADRRLGTRIPKRAGPFVGGGPVGLVFDVLLLLSPHQLLIGAREQRRHVQVNYTPPFKQQIPVVY